jgi:hypothetical protein
MARGSCETPSPTYRASSVLSTCLSPGSTPAGRSSPWRPLSVSWWHPQVHNAQRLNFLVAVRPGPPTPTTNSVPGTRRLRYFRCGQSVQRNVTLAVRRTVVAQTTLEISSGLPLHHLGQSLPCRPASAPGTPSDGRPRPSPGLPVPQRRAPPPPGRSLAPPSWPLPPWQQSRLAPGAITLTGPSRRPRRAPQRTTSRRAGPCTRPHRVPGCVQGAGHRGARPAGPAGPQPRRRQRERRTRDDHQPDAAGSSPAGPLAGDDSWCRSSHAERPTGTCSVTPLVRSCQKTWGTGAATRHEDGRPGGEHDEAAVLARAAVRAKPVTAVAAVAAAGSAVRGRADTRHARYGIDVSLPA